MLLQNPPNINYIYAYSVVVIACYVFHKHCLFVDLCQTSPGRRYDKTREVGINFLG